MIATGGSVSEKLAKASAARREGRLTDSRRLLEEIVAVAPDHGPALNLLGLVAASQGDAAGGLRFLQRAAAADPKAPPVWLNLAELHRVNDDTGAEIAALDKALALDPYLLPALLKKAQALERSGQVAESANVYRALLSATRDTEMLPAPVRDALAHGRALIASLGEAQLQAMRQPLDEVRRQFPGADLSRVEAYAEHLAGRRKIYRQEPAAEHFPYLPALEFFGREQFSWFGDLEKAAAAIRAEFLALVKEDAAEFRPYVEFGPTTPVNQWVDLNHSPRWSAWFFWKDGVRQDRNCARCPATAAAIEKVPLLNITGKGPSVMFSVLQPRTRIPPHTGSSNVRATVHLPLVVPESCGFRVGAEVRTWREGEAWAFDDTIEHEAWNDSDSPRTILILDTWNPLLSEAERAAIRAVT